MAFRVEFSRLAADRFRKLEPEVQERTARKLQEVAEGPRRSLTRLRGVEAFKIRVEDYRIVVDVDWKDEAIYVLTLGHRSTV